MYKVLFTTVYPGPYMDRIFRVLQESGQIELKVFYNYKYDCEKPWENYQPFEGECLDNISWFKWLRMIMRSDFVVIGGWKDKNRILYKNIIGLCFSSFMKKNAFFSDCPKMPKGKINFFIKYIILNFFSNRILGCTLDSKKAFCEWYKVTPNRFYFFPYSHKLPSLEIDEINKERAKALEDGSSIRVLIANRFIERKGYGVVMQALKMLKEESLISQIEFRIAGTGELYDTYITKFKEIDDNITFLGWISDEDYEKELVGTDVYIHASWEEPFGIPPIDAMAFGKLVIVSSQVHSTVDVIQHKTDGLVFNTKNVVALFECLKWTVINKNNIYIIGKKAKVTIEKVFNDELYLKPFQHHHT